MIDAHHHLWDTTRREYAWMDGAWADPLRGSFGPAELAAIIAPHKVETTVVVQALSSAEETIELLAGSGPLVAGVVGWVDLTAPDVASRLTALRSAPGGEKLVGVRHQVQDEPDPRWLLRPEVLRGLRALGDAGLAYDLLVKVRDLPAAVEVTRRLPDVPFVLDHLGKPPIGGPWEPWASHLTELAGRDNVTAKISGLVTEADWRAWTPADLKPYIRHAVDAFGADRLMFGSDWPVCTLAATYDQALSAARSALHDLLTDTERAQVFDATARRVYRLPAPT